MSNQLIEDLEKLGDAKAGPLDESLEEILDQFTDEFIDDVRSYSFNKVGGVVINFKNGAVLKGKFKGGILRWTITMQKKTGQTSIPYDDPEQGAKNLKKQQPWLFSE